jgi:lysyl-tRNA synthetase class I
VTERRDCAPAFAERNVVDPEDEQWNLSSVECPACQKMMSLVSTEKAEANSSAELLTFQCECGQLFATRNRQ